MRRPMTAATDPAAKPRDPWHDERGQFKDGNPGGPGNPQAIRMALVRRRLRASVSEEDFDEVFAALLDLCKKGHFPAIRLFLEYTAGKPGDELGGFDANGLLGVAPPGLAQPEAPVSDRPEAEW